MKNKEKKKIRFGSMGFWFLSLTVLCSVTGIFAQRAHGATTITVKGSTAVAETSDYFVCATIDWWPPEKCNYNQCPWGSSSILNLDLNHPFLVNSVKAFTGLRIRLGGSLQDQVLYGVSDFANECLPFTKNPGRLFGFSKGCLSMERWDELNSFFQDTGAVITFGLNALRGRHYVRNGIWAGSWNSSNARDFIMYTFSKGYPVDSWEFGNELSGHGIGARVDAEQYGKDLVTLKAIIEDIYKESPAKPLLLAPGGFFDRQWYAQLLEVSGSGVINGMTHHIYNLGAGNDSHLVKKILDPHYLDRISDTYSELQHTVQRNGPWASAWVGEAGGVYNNGGRLVSNTFINSFWYLDQLGMASKYNTKAYCRQTLIGGNYGLIDTDSFIPNPDYYSALLWHRLMGTKVLSVDIKDTPLVRAYAHCAKKRTGVAMLLINLSNTTGFSLTIRNEMNTNLITGGSPDGSFLDGLKRTVSWVGSRASDSSPQREEYHLTAKDNNHRSKNVLLNEIPLELTEDGDVPVLDPVLVGIDSPVVLSPISITFVVLPKFEAQACS